MTSEEAIAWIHGRKPFGSRPGLERVQALLELLDHPETKVPTIHIAGTNGKGSTISYLRSIMEEKGLTVGTFTSPYIEMFHERMAINGYPISDDDLVTLVQKIQPLVAQLDQIEAVQGITEFEVLTAIAFDYFLEKKVDIALIEVGLGGLLDSTNVVRPILTAITTIGMDHTEILGETLEEIASQKAGIIKPGVPLVTGKITEPALSVIRRTAKEKHAKISGFGEEYQIDYQHPDPDWGEIFDFQNQAGRLKKLKTSLIGRHQTENAGVAIQLYWQYCQLRGIPFQEKEVRRGLKKTFWPGRMEKISTDPLVILDGAHNPHAMARLVENMRTEFGHYRIHVLFSALSVKDVNQMIHQLLTIPEAEVYVTTFDYPRAIDLAEHRELSKDDRVNVVSLWQFGLAEILEKMSTDDMLLITGSLYFVSEVRHLLLNMGGKND